MRHFFRYVFVLLFSVLLPAALVFNGKWVDERILYVSVGVALASATGAFYSVRKLASFPGNRTWATFVPAIGVWYGLFAMLVLVFRLPYSVVYISASFCLCLVYVHLDYWFFDGRKVLSLYYVPIGRAVDADRIPHAVWTRLDAPSLPSALCDAVVADLHAPSLTTEWQRFLAECTLKHIPVYNIRQVEESLTGRVRIRHMYENDLGSLLPSETYSILKRVIEAVLVLAAMPVALPIMLVTGLAIRMESPGGAMFLQRRVGQFGKEFTIYKFRSMCKDSEKDGAKFASASDMRVTRIGKFIRKTRIDELPQFFNVLKGDMALIGPRPEQKAFVEKFQEIIPFYDYRHIVKPGITGWAQVVHGYAADADETQVKIEHDFYYIKNFSFGLDFLIIIKTIYTLATGFGAR